MSLFEHVVNFFYLKSYSWKAIPWRKKSPAFATSAIDILKNMLHISKHISKHISSCGGVNFINLKRLNLLKSYEITNT